MTETKLGITKEQAMALNSLSIRATKNFFLALWGLFIFLFVVVVLALGDTEAYTSSTIAFIWFAGQLVCAYILKWLLLRFVLKPTKGWQLRFTRDMSSINFHSYQWRWFFAVSGGIIACEVLSHSVPLAHLISFYGATYYILTRLIKSGDAVLERVK